MIYNSVQIIPAKLFFHISETEEYGLLSDKKLDSDQLKTIWLILEEEHKKLNPNKKVNKTLDLSKKIEELYAKHQKILLAVQYLKSRRDEDLIELLEKSNYHFDLQDYDNSLERIERESQSILIRIESLEKKLPKPTTTKETVTFDQTVMSYSAFSGSGFINPNKITLSQYYALINIGNNKMKALENGKK